MMNADPLRDASPELRQAVDAMGGQKFLAAIDDLVQANEERTLDWFDARWDDLTADEVIEWTIGALAHTGPGVAHAALDVALRTYPVEEQDDDDVAGAATMVTAFVRVLFGSETRADRYEFDYESLSKWIQRDAVRFVSESSEDTPSAEAERASDQGCG